MEHDYKKINQLIGWLLIIIVVCFSIDLIIVGGGVANDSNSAQAASSAAVKNSAISAPDQAQLGEILSGLLLCGQWPVTSTRLSEGRGNPFEPKKLQPRPLFMAGMTDPQKDQPDNNCLTVQEVLNK